MIEERIQTSIQFGVDAMKAYVENGVQAGPTKEEILDMARIVTKDYNATFTDYMNRMIECPLPPS